MKAVYLEKSQVPAALIGSYTGRKFKARVSDSVTLRNTYWSGGTRSTYRAASLANGESRALPGNPAPYHFGGNMEGQTIDLVPGYAIVEHSIFCGKDMGLVFHIHPDNAQKLLPDTADLDAFETIVLAATATYKASYGGIKNFRLHEAHSSTKITLDDWNAAKSRLMARKYLNKAGAITPAGRNALGDKRLPYRGNVYDNPAMFTD